MLSNLAIAGLAAAALSGAVAGAQAQNTVKIGVLLPMTGPQQSTGVQILAAMRLYMAQHGDTVAGKKIEIVLRDEGAVAENAKRLAEFSRSQEGGSRAGAVTVTVWVQPAGAER